MNSLEANDLWRRFIGGDDEALSKLYLYYVHKLFSYGLKIHGDEFLVKDCIQEVFIHLIDKRKKLIIISESPTVYIFRALRNKLLEELRSKNRRVDIVNSFSSREFNFEPTVEQIIVELEEEKLLTRKIKLALNKLSDYQKEAIFLKYSQGFEYEKIAELLEIDVASARTLIYRTLKKVREQIDCKSQFLFFIFSSLCRQFENDHSI